MHNHPKCGEDLDGGGSVTSRSLIMHLRRFSNRVRSLASSPVRCLRGVLASFFGDLRKAWGSVMARRGARTALILVVVAGITAGFSLGLRSHYFAGSDEPNGPPAMGKLPAPDDPAARKTQAIVEREIVEPEIAKQGSAKQSTVEQGAIKRDAIEPGTVKHENDKPKGDLSAKAEDATLPKNEELMMPVPGKVIRSFGWSRHPVYGDWRFHPGLDIEVPPGTPVRAALSGKIVQAGKVADYGMAISISHAGDISTFYGHLGSITVHVGDMVRQGEVIGVSGDTGVATVPQVYFEVRKGQEPIEPDKL